MTGPGQLLPWTLAVEFGPPQGLVGVDVADAGDQRLVEQQPLDARGALAHAAYEVVVVELRVEWVASDVGDLWRQVRSSG